MVPGLNKKNTPTHGTGNSGNHDRRVGNIATAILKKAPKKYRYRKPLFSFSRFLFKNSNLFHSRTFSVSPVRLGLALVTCILSFEFCFKLFDIMKYKDNHLETEIRNKRR